jgi:type VI protein secretion system component Hcp
MKKTVWIGAAILALAAAIPLWLVFDGGGDRRAAALVDPNPNNDIGRLTIAGVNGGAPIGIRSFALAAKFDATPGPHIEYPPFEISKSIDALSPIVYGMLLQQPRQPGDAPNAKLELLAGGKPYMSYDLPSVALVRWALMTAKLDTFTFNYGSPESKTPAGADAPVAPAASVVGEMEIPLLGKNAVPITAFHTGSSKTPVLDGGPTHEPEPIEVERAIDALAAPLMAALKPSDKDRLLGVVTIRLREPGSATPYATYTFKNVSVLSITDSASAGSLAKQKLTLTFKDFEMKIGGQSVTAIG